ncbi:MAG: GHKL domain-containing protein [Eubacterium sp.]|nr:GHKL domain-containing protein [Eubacterium sp.]
MLLLFFNERRNEKKLSEYEEKLVASQLDEMNQLYMTMRGWRHDYHNHMQKIRAHLALGEYDQVQEYINLMETELDAVDIRYKSGNTGVDAMLNSKLTLAEKKGLRIKCDAELPKKLSCNPVDLCVLLGNLIDNAIEACEKMDPSQDRFIRIYMCVRKKQFYLSVSNATSEVIRKLDREYITNKRGNHGNGLRRINKVVEKNNGFINRQNEPGVFATEVMLPLE